MRHVDHLLAAYVEGQLDAQNARSVYLHAQTCRDCHARLASHELLARRVRAIAGTEVSPTSDSVARLWRSIRSATQFAGSAPKRPAWIPVLIGIVAALLPMTLGITSLVSWQPTQTLLATTTALLDTESPEQVPVAAITVPRPRLARRLEIQATEPPPQKSLPPAPAPLAPFRP